MAEIGSLSASSAQEKSFAEEVLGEIARNKARVTESPDKQSSKGAAPNLDRFLSNLHNFMGLMLEKTKPTQVLIGNIAEIEEAVKKEKACIIYYFTIFLDSNVLFAWWNSFTFWHLF